MDFASLIFLLFFVLIVKFLLKPRPPAINGVYSQPDNCYWLKYCVFRVILWLRKRKQNKEVKVGQDAGLGRKSRNSPEEMDRVQPLSADHPGAVDAVYLTGSNKDGQFFVTATARRHDSLVQTIVYLRLPDLGFLELPSMPDTSLRGSMENEYSAGGLHIQVLEPMKTWTMKFDGKLRQVSSGKLLDVKFNLTWEACTRYLDFDTDIHPAIMCDAIAREKWSRKFFDALKTLHQTHYEQFGDTTGTVNIEGHDPIQLDVRGIRDHSYGNNRNWWQLHRYCIQYASFEDGTNINIAIISMPETFSRLACGAILHTDGRLETVSWCDMEFQDWGDDGKPSMDFTIKFKADGKLRILKAKVLDWRQFYIGKGRDAKIYERYTEYYLDGVKGYGLSEWEYANTDGTDPQNNMGLNY